MTTWAKYFGVAGQYSISVPALLYVTVLKVKRQGLGFDILNSGTPGNRQVVYDAAAGSLTFNTAFIDAADPTAPVDNVEGVYVLYKV